MSRSSRKKSSNLIDQLTTVPRFCDLSRQQTANEINLGFLEPHESFQRFDPFSARVIVDEEDEDPTIDPMHDHSALIKQRQSFWP